MHHVFDVEDSSALSTIVWTELKKQGIKETGRCRKPTRNNNNNVTIFCIYFKQSFYFKYQSLSLGSSFFCLKTISSDVT